MPLRLSPKRQCIYATIVALFVSTNFGCKGGPPPEVVGQVSGTVKYEGKPLSGCYVQFADPTRGIFVVALIDEQGHYEIATAKGRGLSVGTYQISLMPRHLPAEDDPNPNRFPMPGPSFPEKYRDAKTSGLTYKIESGVSTFDIDVKP